MITYKLDGSNHLATLQNEKDNREGSKKNGANICHVLESVNNIINFYVCQ